jgi:hypothetical protein
MDHIFITFHHSHPSHASSHASSLSSSHSHSSSRLKYLKMIAKAVTGHDGRLGSESNKYLYRCCSRGTIGGTSRGSGWRCGRRACRRVFKNTARIDAFFRTITSSHRGCGNKGRQVQQERKNTNCNHNSECTNVVKSVSNRRNGYFRTVLVYGRKQIKNVRQRVMKVLQRLGRQKSNKYSFADTYTYI